MERVVGIGEWLHGFNKWIDADMWTSKEQRWFHIEVLKWTNEAKHVVKMDWPNMTAPNAGAPFQGRWTQDTTCTQKISTGSLHHIFCFNYLKWTLNKLYAKKVQVIIYYPKNTIYYPTKLESLNAIYNIYHYRICICLFSAIVWIDFFLITLSKNKDMKLQVNLHNFKFAAGKKTWIALPYKLWYSSDVWSGKSINIKTWEFHQLPPYCFACTLLSTLQTRPKFTPFEVLLLACWVIHLVVEGKNFFCLMWRKREQ